jgi:hypothetical protein
MPHVKPMGRAWHRRARSADPDHRKQYVHRFRSLEHARQVVADFIGRYIREQLLERQGYYNPDRGPPELHSEGCLIKQPWCPKSRNR